MAGYHTFQSIRPVLGDGRPQVPVVSMALVRGPFPDRPKKPRRSRAIAPKVQPAAKPVVEEKGFIPPKALTPQDFEQHTAFPVRRLIALVAGVSQISQDEIVSERRNVPAVKARQIVYWLAFRFNKFSLPHIGRQIGGRDHTTILSGVRKVQAAIDRLDIQVSDCPVDMADELWSADWTARAE